MKIKNKELIIAAVNIIAMSMIFIFYSEIIEKPYKTWICSIYILIIISLTIQILSLATANNRNILGILFLIFSYMFHLGFIPLINMNYDFGETIINLPFERIGKAQSITGMNLSYLCIYALYLGLLLDSLFGNKKYKLKLRLINYFYVKEEEQQSFGQMLIIVCLPFYILRTIYTAYISITMGYDAAVDLKFNAYFNIFSLFFIPGGLIYILSTKVSRKQANITYLFLVSICLLSMLTGQRSYNLMYIGLLTIAVVKKNGLKKLKSTHIIIAILLMLLVSKILVIIRYTREMGMSISNIKKTIRFISKSSSLMEILNENAITSNVVAMAIDKIKVPTGGIQLLSSFLIMIPGISYILPWFPFDKTNITDVMNSWNLGGSYIADFYFDFGNLAVIACFIFGIIIGAFFRKFYYSVNDSNTTYFAALALPFTEIFFSVRSSLYKLPRDIFEYIIFFALFLSIYRTLVKNNNNIY